MDSDKLKKLKDVNWRPAKNCGSCVNGEFLPGRQWGTCALDANTYWHNKHERLHKLPAHRSATCDYYCENPEGSSAELRQFLSSKVTS